MGEIYENPDKPKMVRNLKFAVELYTDILKLREPYFDLLRLQEKIKKDHDEYTLLRDDLNRPLFFERVKYYIDKYDDDRRGLGDYMESFGFFLDAGNWTTEFEHTGRTCDHEFKYIQAAYRLDTQGKKTFRKRYDYLQGKGKQDLPAFQLREQQNRVLFATAMSKIVDGDLEKHKKAIARAENKLKLYSGYPTPLYFAASSLSEHIHATLFNKSTDEYVDSYLTDEEKALVLSGKLYVSDITTKKLNRVEAYIEKIAKNEIILSDINPRPKNKDEDQPE